MGVNKASANTNRQIHHNHQPDSGSVDHTAHAGKADPGKAAKAKTAAPAEHMSKTQRAAVDGLVKRQTPKSRLESIRAILAKNPGLADHYVAERLRGHNSVEHQIVHAVLARSGTTGIQRLAMCESAVRQIQGLGRTRQADVLALVKTGSSVHAAVKLVRGAVADIKAEAAAKSRQSMAHKLDGAVKSLRHEAAQWKKTSDEVNALYRQVPRLSRFAEGVVGFVNGTAAVGDLAMAGVEYQYTLDGHAFDEALDKADRSGSYVVGEFSEKVDEARSLYTEFSRQHIDYVEQNNRMQRAVKSGDFQTQIDARARMDKLAAAMKQTVARFRPTAEKAVRMDHQFNDDTKAAAEHIVVTGAMAGTEELGEAVENLPQAFELGASMAVKDGLVSKGVEVTEKGVDRGVETFRSSSARPE